MKNSKLLRVILIALAAVMTFSLFACTETPENPEESQSSSEESTLNTNETDPKEPTNGSEETSDVNSEEKTEETSEETTEGTTVETSEEMTEETTVETTAETSEETSEETTTEISEETTEETTETPACEHVEELVKGTPATCEDAGLTDGKKCTACGETLVEQQVIPALGHAWDKGTVTTAPDCENKGTKTYTCANDANHTKTEEIAATGHSTTWQYVSNEGTEYEGTRYAVEGKVCATCKEVLETRPAIIAFNIDGMNAANSAGAAADFSSLGGSGYGVMVTDPTARVTANEAIYLRNNQFIVAAGWVGINGDFNTSNAYYRILDENGNPLTDWVEKPISNTDKKGEDTGSYKSIKGQLAAHGVTDFVARGFKTNNLNTTIDGVDYAKYDKPIAIEYALRSTSAPEGSDLITVIVFKNVYKVCTSHSCSDWQYISGEGTEFEGKGYAVQGGTCDNCGEYVVREAVIAFNFDSVASADKTGTGNSMAAFGTGGGAMVTDPDARVTTQDKIYLRNNQFLMGSGWLGVAGEIDINNAYYRILNNETGAVVLDWQAKPISDSSSSSVRPQVKPEYNDKGESVGSYTSVKNQLNAQGITDFTAYGFRTNNLVTNIGGTEYASTTTPIAIEYAVKIVGAPEGYDLIRVIIFKNVYKVS